MTCKCPRCHAGNRPEARFCAHCGLSLAAGLDGTLTAGRIRHPDPLAAPEGFAPCDHAANLYYRWESAWGGRTFLGTESIAVTLFNGGYPLQHAVFAVQGRDESGRQLFASDHTADELPRGQEVRIEVPSYELPAAPRELTVSLVAAEFGPES
jgi:hypothetical protein